MRKRKITRIITALLCISLLMQTTMVSFAEESMGGTGGAETGNAVINDISQTTDNADTSGSVEAPDTSETDGR